VQHIGRRIRQQSIFVQQLADCIHPLTSAPDHAALTARGAAHCALRFSSLVHKGRVEAPYSGCNDFSRAVCDVDYSPTT
jgi:hypothetical protein